MTSRKRFTIPFFIAIVVVVALFAFALSSCASRDDDYLYRVLGPVKREPCLAPNVRVNNVCLTPKQNAERWHL